MAVSHLAGADGFAGSALGTIIQVLELFIGNRCAAIDDFVDSAHTATRCFRLDPEYLISRTQADTQTATHALRCIRYVEAILRVNGIIARVFIHKIKHGYDSMTNA